MNRQKLRVSGEGLRARRVAGRIAARSISDAPAPPDRRRETFGRNGACGYGSEKGKVVRDDRRRWTAMVAPYFGVKVGVGVRGAMVLALVFGP